VELASPPITTLASGRCTSAPVDVENAIGISPKLATNAMINTGRSLRLAPLRTAWRVASPDSSSWLMELTITTPFSMANIRAIAIGTIRSNRRVVSHGLGGKVRPADFNHHIGNFRKLPQTLLDAANPGTKLSLGMFVNVKLDLSLGRQLVIPASGVYQSGTRQTAFVDHGDGHFEPREIEVGASAGDDFVVTKGLKAGERVVTSANFLMDSESQLQAAMGSFAPPPPGAGAASAANAPQATLDYSSDPSTPRLGTNTLRVKLTGSDGAPILGAQVTVTFFMPAMPAMGMASMRNVATLSEKSGGVYEGPVQIQMGGTWQVTLLATKNGQTIAQKQISETAQGGTQ